MSTAPVVREAPAPKRRELDPEAVELFRQVLGGASMPSEITMRAILSLAAETGFPTVEYGEGRALQGEQSWRDKLPDLIPFDLQRVSAQLDEAFRRQRELKARETAEAANAAAGDLRDEQLGQALIEAEAERQARNTPAAVQQRILATLEKIEQHLSSGK